MKNHTMLKIRFVMVIVVLLLFQTTAGTAIEITIYPASEQTTEVSKIKETQEIEQRQNDTSSYLIGDQIFNILVLSDDMDELIAYLESEGYYGDESVNGDSDKNTYLRKYIANRNSHSIYSVSICFFLDDIISIGIQLRKQTDDEPTYEQLSGIFEVMVGNTKLMDNGRSWEYRTSMITVMPIADDEYQQDNPNSTAKLLDVIRGNCDYEIQLILPTILSETVPNGDGKRSALVGSKAVSSVSNSETVVKAIEITDMIVRYNSIGTPELYLSVKNTRSNDSIIAFTLATRCYDAYGNLLKEYGFGDSTQYRLWQEDIIKPSGTWTSDNTCWVLYGLDAAYTIEVWITSVRTLGGITINVPYNQQSVSTWKRR